MSFPYFNNFVALQVEDGEYDSQPSEATCNGPQSSNWSQYQYLSNTPESLQHPAYYETPQYIPGAYSGTYLEYGHPATPTYNNPFPSAELPSQDGYGDVVNYSGDYDTPPLLPQGFTNLFPSTPLNYPIPIYDTPILSSQPQTSRSVISDNNFLGSGTSGPSYLPQGLASSSDPSSDAVEAFDPVASSSSTVTISGPARRSGTVPRARDTPYTRSGAPSAKSKKSERIYLLQYPSNEPGPSVPGTSTERQPLGELRPTNGSTLPILVEKDTGNDVSHLLRTVEDDRFSTWLRLDDGSAGKVLGHWWCRSPQCDYHTNRKADMHGHVVVHASGSAKAFNCKTLVPGFPCRCSNEQGMSSDHRKSVKKHMRSH